MTIIDFNIEEASAKFFNKFLVDANAYTLFISNNIISYDKNIIDILINDMEKLNNYFTCHPYITSLNKIYMVPTPVLTLVLENNKEVDFYNQPSYDFMLIKGNLKFDETINDYLLDYIYKLNEKYNSTVLYSFDRESLDKVKYNEYIKLIDNKEQIEIVNNYKKENVINQVINKYKEVK